MFKQLRERVPTGSTDFMRYRNLSKMTVQTYSFSPEISRHSEVLAQNQLHRFLAASHDSSRPCLPQRSADQQSNTEPEDDIEQHVVADERNFAVGEEWQLSPAHSSKRAGSNEPPSRFYQTTNTSSRTSQKRLTKCERQEARARIQLIYEKHKNAMKEIERKRATSKRDELKDCTFRPALTASASYSRLPPNPHPGSRVLAYATTYNRMEIGINSNSEPLTKRPWTAARSTQRPTRGNIAHQPLPSSPHPVTTARGRGGSLRLRTAFLNSRKYSWKSTWPLG